MTPKPAGKTYGTADPTLTGTLAGFLTGDYVTATYGRAAGEAVAGSPYTVSAALAPAAVLGNYNITYNTASFTINGASLTGTANNQNKVYGASLPAFTVTYTGFVNGDTAAVLTGTLSCSTTATASSPASPPTYPITCSGQSAANYTITYVAGALTITKAGQTITFPAIATHDDSNPPFKISATASSGLTVTFTASGKCTVTGNTVTLLNVGAGTGTCTITANQPGNGNYNAAPSVARTFTIT